MPPYQGRIGKGEGALEGRKPLADREKVRARLRSERGFGLIELLMPTFSITIAIRSSMRPKPRSLRSRARRDDARNRRQHLQVRHHARRVVPQLDRQ